MYVCIVLDITKMPHTFHVVNSINIVLPTKIISMVLHNYIFLKHAKNHNCVQKNVYTLINLCKLQIK